MGDLDCNLSRSLKVKSGSAIAFPSILLMFNSSIWSNMASSHDIRVQNMSNLEFDLSMLLKVKSNGAVGLPIITFY